MSATICLDLNNSKRSKSSRARKFRRSGVSQSDGFGAGGDRTMGATSQAAETAARTGVALHSALPLDCCARMRRRSLPCCFVRRQALHSALQLHLLRARLKSGPQVVPNQVQINLRACLKSCDSTIFLVNEMPRHFINWAFHNMKHRYDTVSTTDSHQYFPTRPPECCACRLHIPTHLDPCSQLPTFGFGQ